MRGFIFALLALLLPQPCAADGAGGFIGPPAAQLRCTLDGRRCIGRADYLGDTCGLIEATAAEAGIDPGYFARLLWQESRYDAEAQSPAGAQGIAQFMPATAKFRGLDDPFNPAQAIEAAARYLGEMTARYGNPGLAAAGYNGGEDRLAAFIAQREGLPGETLDYVRAITGHPAEDWRDAPPAAVDFRLDGTVPFRTACVSRARDRAKGPAAQVMRAPLPTWGVIVAAGRTPRSAEVFGRRAAKQHPAVIDAAKLRFVQAVIPGFGRRAQYTAQMPATSRGEAQQLCDRLRARGGFCKVIGN
jgi:hypothetical protein